LFLSQYLSKPIDITSITTVELVGCKKAMNNKCSVSCKSSNPNCLEDPLYKVYFKEVESESKDVWIEFEQAIADFTKEFVKVHEVAPHPFDVMFWLKENKQFTITRK
jgi:hypothetical protein